ncbi:Cytochrome monooxygenase sdnT like protein [Verticillium longisporum]|nr:Cytochrome monooxygenase sdnT like protein [Verticillium longisporum]
MSVRQWLVFTVLRAVPAVLLAVVLAACAIIFYRLALHPLARVPGPKLAAISNVWHALHVRDGRMFVLGKTLHKKYGPVVRVGPNEVWFDSKDAFKSIYRAGSGYEKSEFYLATLLQKPTMDWMGRLHFPDSLDLLSERDISRYRLQRRLIGPIYQTASLKRHEPAIDAVLEKIVTQIRGLDGAEVDLKEWMHIIAVECLGAIVLSWSPGYLKDKTDWGSSSHGYLGWRRKSVFGLFPIIVKAEIISGEISYAFARLWGLTHKAAKTLKPFFTGVYRQSSRRITAELAPKAVKPSKLGKTKKPAASDRHDLLNDLIQLHKEKPEFNERYLRRMAVTNFGAGHETMCSALTSIMAMIGSNPSVQAKVAAEVRSAENSSSFDHATHLPYMQATIKEAQRLHPVLGMSLSRTVPAEGLQAHGHHFPAGTIVGCNPVSLHRNKEIFGVDADSFNPSRWLDTNDVRTMDRYNLTWGGGNRTCPGRHLAYLVVYKVIPALMSEFDVEVAMPPEEEIRYYFMAMLTGVKVRFRPKAGLDEAQVTTGGLM